MPATEEQFQWQEDLGKDGTKRLPIIFCLDTSSSMRVCLEGGIRTGERVWYEKERRMGWAVKGGVCALDQLNKGMKYFFSCIQKNMYALSATEVAIVTFDDDAHLLKNFCRVRDVDQNILDHVQTGDCTFMGEGIQMALDKLEECLNSYKAYGIDYYAPWLILMSDGEPNGSNFELQDAKKRIASFCRDENMLIFPIAVGKRVNKKILSEIAMGRETTDIYGVDFTGLFDKMSEAAVLASEAVQEIEVESILEGEEVVENEFYETTELKLSEEQIDLMDVVY